MTTDNKKFLLKEFTSFEYDDDDVKNVAEKGGPMILKGILQKANTLNQNGRVYPHNILEREIRNYEKLIREKRAFGELDHCLDDQSEILTISGWKLLKDINEDEEIYTLNTITGLVEKEVIQKKTAERFDGFMYHLHGDRDIDMLMTPNHNMLVWSVDNVPLKISSEAACGMFREKNSPLTHCYVKVAGINEALLMPGLDSAMLYTSPENSSKVWFRTSESLKFDKTEYHGNVYCVTTKNGNFMARRKGTAMWTGNSDTPIVNMKNISHTIREIWMEGDVVYGKVEILDTPCGKIIEAIVKAGCKPGISSRALGSLQRENNVNVVQDDLQIICWDFVSEPSTPSAFMHLAEAKVIDMETARKAFNKSDFVERAANEILSLKKT